MTAKKIRSYFKALKKIARREGGAIGFIEEIDAFATTRGGLDSSTPIESATAPVRGLFGRMRSPAIASGTGGTVNELLIQMQSFDTLPFAHRMIDKLKEKVNLFLPPERQIMKRRPPYHNVLVIAATNRGDSLDPALMRPGRFDQRLYFDLPSRAGRRELIDHFLSRKRHGSELDDGDRREELAGMTFGYSPVQIEHLLDEGLIVALRHGRDRLTWSDVTSAKLTEDIGLPHAESYTPNERRQIATHEAGHAVTAYLVGEGRRLEVLSIIKRRQALGLLAHSDAEERFTKSGTELYALMVIAMAGMAAEELFEGESGTGPAGDLAAATQIAAEMVGSLGLAGSLVSYRAVSENMFDSGFVGRVISTEGTRRSVEDLLGRAKMDARRLLRANRKLVMALRNALLDREELIGEQITDVLEAVGGKRAQTALRKAMARPKSRSRTTRAASTPPSK
jgi:ATP-dependent Zn protease